VIEELIPLRATSSSSMQTIPSKPIMGSEGPATADRSLKRLRSARVISTGHAFVQISTGPRSVTVDSAPHLVL
jgi:hypothetical protein